MNARHWNQVANCGSLGSRSVDYRHIDGVYRLYSDQRAAGAKLSTLFSDAPATRRLVAALAPNSSIPSIFCFGLCYWQRLLP